MRSSGDPVLGQLHGQRSFLYDVLALRPVGRGDGG